MKISIVLCTYNRCQLLAKALESVAASRLPDTVEWELLIVDNNSTDKTRDVAQEFCRRFPEHFRYVFEPRQGKSNALNTGIGNAQGDVIAFLDDDITVEPTWLQNLTVNLDGNQWSGAGGRILPDWVVPPPHWLPIGGRYDLRGMLGMFDIGDKARELDRPPFGSNMAFRKSLFEKYGGFRTDLGPTSQGGYKKWYASESPRTSEDTEFGRRVRAAGERLRYEPSAIIYHHVPLERLEKGYFLAFWFDHGRAAVRGEDKKPNILGIPRCYFSVAKTSASLVLRTLQWTIAWEPKLKFYRKGWVWMTAGKLVEYCRQSARSGRSANSAIGRIQPRRPLTGPLNKQFKTE